MCCHALSCRWPGCAAFPSRRGAEGDSRSYQHMQGKRLSGLGSRSSKTAPGSSVCCFNLSSNVLSQYSAIDARREARINYISDSAAKIIRAAGKSSGRAFGVYLADASPEVPEDSLHIERARAARPVPYAAYLTLQYDRIYHGLPPLDQKAWTWLAETLPSQALCGSWRADLGQINLCAEGAGEWFEDIGARCAW